MGSITLGRVECSFDCDLLDPSFFLRLLKEDGTIVSMVVVFGFFFSANPSAEVLSINEQERRMIFFNLKATAFVQFLYR